jgi:hypothetical protein
VQAIRSISDARLVQQFRSTAGGDTWRYTVLRGSQSAYTFYASGGTDKQASQRGEREGMPLLATLNEEVVGQEVKERT